MPKGKVKDFIKRRPSWFWWTLAQLLAGAFAIASWSFCLFLFHNPERPWNYEFLRMLGRITPVVVYAPLEAPEGTPSDPQALLSKFYPMDDEQLIAYNTHFKRNYITSFAKPEVVSYVEGTYHVTHTRLLTEEDFFHPGLAVRAQAVVQTDELAEASPYPVILEILLPFKDPPTGEILPVDHPLVLKYIEHRALILHASRAGNEKEPSVCLTVVPLSFENFLDPSEKKLPLSPPDPLNLATTFPAMEENRP